MEETEIKTTKNFKQFSLLEYNRTVCPAHVKRLKHQISIQNDLHLFPIIVTPDLEVVDGQHRLQAAKELNIEIHYLIDGNYNSQKIITFNNNQRRWSIEDRLKFYSETGNEHYVKLNDLVKDIGFSLPCLLIWMTDESNRQSFNFKNGHFKFELTQNRFESIIRAKKLLSIMKKNSFKPVNIYTQAFFHRALKKILCNEFVDFSRLENRFEKAFHLMRYCNSSYSYGEVFLDIYNFSMQNHNLKIQRDKTTYDYVK